MIEGRTIVSAEYGSRAVGVETEDSDHDVMCVFMETAEHVTGIESVSTITDGTAAPGERSTASDIDIVKYPLRKWATLAALGNPTVLSLLFTDRLISYSDTWQEIRGIREAFISKEAGRKFRGYSWGQRQALVGARNKRTNRPELVHKHGYDTKFGYHMIRTAMQGVELMTTGTLTLPMQPSQSIVLRSIRAGTVSKESVLALSEHLDLELEAAIAAADLPNDADRSVINSTLHAIYLDEWRAPDAR